MCADQNLSVALGLRGQLIQQVSNVLRLWRMLIKLRLFKSQEKGWATFLVASCKFLQNRHNESPLHPVPQSRYFTDEFRLLQSRRGR